MDQTNVSTCRSDPPAPYVGRAAARGTSGASSCECSSCTAGRRCRSSRSKRPSSSTAAHFRRPRPNVEDRRFGPRGLRRGANASPKKGSVFTAQAKSPTRQEPHVGFCDEQGERPRLGVGRSQNSETTSLRVGGATTKPRGGQGQSQALEDSSFRRLVSRDTKNA